MGKFPASIGSVRCGRRVHAAHAAFGIVTALCVLGHPANAAPVPISGYDIGDAVLSGHGFWAHSYAGTITPSGTTFNNFGFPGETATYNGVGGGTLTDGVIGTSVANSQLFVTPAASDGTPITPSIVLTLPFAYSVDTIEIFGGDISGNGIPGALTGFSVGLLDQSFNFIGPVAFTTTDFGPGTNSMGGLVNDRVSLAGSALDGVPAFALFLSDFQGTNSNWFSITEIKLDGSPFEQPVPLPAALPLFLTALTGVACVGRRKQVRA